MCHVIHVLFHVWVCRSIKKIFIIATALSINKQLRLSLNASSRKIKTTSLIARNINSRRRNKLHKRKVCLPLTALCQFTLLLIDFTCSDNFYNWLV